MTTEEVTVNIADLVEIILNIVNSAGAGSAATATNSGASAGTARTTSNAEQDAKDAFKSSFVSEQVDSDTSVEEGYQVHAKYWESLAALNGKRTYDLHQSMDLDDFNRLRRREEVLFNIETQVLQNAVETGNILAKQAIAHRDIAIQSQWKDKGRTDIEEEKG
jgi:hypothetical protein